MANLEITRICNLQCNYCFAKDSLSETHQPGSQKLISLKSFENHLDFLDRSNIDQIRLIGGEPTMHPQFDEIIEGVFDNLTAATSITIAKVVANVAKPFYSSSSIKSGISGYMKTDSTHSYVLE